MFIGAGTVLNVALILAGSLIGLLLGARLPERTRTVTTDALGLVTLLVAVTSAAAITDASFVAAVSAGGVVLVVLGAMLVGSISGSLLGIEKRLEHFGDHLRRRFGGRDTAGAPRFVEGFVTASLIFCIGPLAILGAISDGLGTGIDQLVLKSVLDFFASMAFAAALGPGVAASAIPVGIYQGAFTAIGFGLGGVMPDYQIAAMTAVGGLLLVGVSLRLLQLKALPVGDMLPALAFAPAVAWLATRF